MLPPSSNNRKSSMQLKLALMLVAALALASCAPQMALSGPNEALVQDRPEVMCAVDQPITWSAKDSDATIGQIKAHNRAWTTLCPIMKGPR